MSLIIETDLGRDPDDFFALCWLIHHKVDIKAIVISPGDKDQIAVAKFLLKECGLNIPVGSAKPDREKNSAGGVHIELLKRYNYPMRVDSVSGGWNIIDSFEQCELFACGPLQNIGPYLRAGGSFSGATMQGGFIGYDVHGKTDVVRLDKFEGKVTQPTFNLGGDKESGKLFVSAKFPKKFVGKNVCHTVLYDISVHERIKSSRPTSRAGELFREAMDYYLKKQPFKAFHDPLAAILHIYPEIGTWVKGQVYYEKGEWGTRLSEDGDDVLIDIDREAFWNKACEI